MNPIAARLKTIHENAMSKEGVRRTDLLNQRSRNDIEDLIAVHCKSFADVQKILGAGYSSRDKVSKIINEVSKETGIFMRTKKNKNKLIPLELMHAILEHEKVPAWRDMYTSFCHVIAIANLKGGTGKSATALNIATEFALSLFGRAKVLLLDLDPQGTNSVGALGIDTDSSDLLTPTDFMLSDIEDGVCKQYLEQGYTLEELIPASILETHIPNLNVMTSFPDDERFYRVAKGTDNEIYKLLDEKVIKHLKGTYDIIIIDTPPTASVFNWAAIEASTGVVIPCTPQAPDKKSTDYYCKELAQIIDNSPTACEKLSWFKFMATNYNPSKEQDIFDRMRDDFGQDMLHSYIINAECFSIASDNYRSVVDMFKDTKGNLSGARQSIENVTRDIRQILIDESNKVRGNY
jgi:cellulose biosynthesis protein BcsQ